MSDRLGTDFVNNDIKYIPHSCVSLPTDISVSKPGLSNAACQDPCLVILSHYPILLKHSGSAVYYP